MQPNGAVVVAHRVVTPFTGAESSNSPSAEHSSRFLVGSRCLKARAPTLRLSTCDQLFHYSARWSAVILLLSRTTIIDELIVDSLVVRCHHVRSEAVFKTRPGIFVWRSRRSSAPPRRGHRRWKA